MKLSKVLSVVVVALMLISTVANIAYAIDPATISSESVSGADSVKRLGGQVLNIIQVVGSVVSVVVLVVLGIKYMMGSTEEKAEYKKTLIPYVVGAILIFAASNIASMVYKAASGITLAA